MSSFIISLCTTTVLSPLLYKLWVKKYFDEYSKQLLSMTEYYLYLTMLFINIFTHMYLTRIILSVYDIMIFKLLIIIIGVWNCVRFFKKLECLLSICNLNKTTH